MLARKFSTGIIIALLCVVATQPMARIAHAVSGSPQTLTGTVPEVVQHGQAHLNGHHNSADLISLAIGLPLRNKAGLEAYLQGVNDPADPQYHHFLSQTEVNASYNPTSDDEQRVAQWLGAHGLQVTRTYPNHLLIDAQGMTTRVEQAFGITINDYSATVRGKSRSFYAPDRDPSVDGQIADVVNSIGGLDSFPRFHLLTNGTAHNTPAYFPQDLANAYDVNPLWNSGYNGSGQHIGITLWTVPPSDSTLQHYASTTGASVATTANGRLHVIPVDGGTTSSASPDDGEAGLDIESASGMAPGATIDYYEIATDSLGNISASGMLDALNLGGTDNNNNQEITNSWGGCEASSASDPFTTSQEQIFASNSATGHNYFFSTGDNGSWCGGADPGPGYPASSPHVTSVGGTKFSASINGAYPGEAAWDYCSTCSSNQPEGSGGGYSGIFARPSWQVGSGLAGNGQRGYPDISTVGDPNTGVYTCYGNNSACAQFGGTSLSSPLWAGMLADINQYVQAQGKNGVGFLAPTLYRLGTHSQPYAPFHDVTSGTNGAYNTGPGWDPVTGWGTPDVWNVARDIAGTTPTSVLTASPNPVPGGTGSGTTTVSWNTGDGSLGQVYVSVNGGGDALFTQGASGSASAPWISTGSTFTFKLYAGTGHSTVLKSVTVTRSGLTLTASPNPVPAGTGAGTTTLSWDTGNGSFGQVYVSANAGADVLFATGANGSATAPWISTGSTYTFKLYAGTGHTTILKTVAVTRTGVTLTASPNPVPTGSATTTVSWNTGDGSLGQVYVSVNGGGDALFTQGASGSASAPWISTGSTFTFKLYAGTGHAAVLASVSVTHS